MPDLSSPRSRSEAEEADGTDPLRAWRTRFSIPPGIYLAGNSLGPAPHAVAGAVAAAVTNGWGHDAVGAWHQQGWWELPDRVGARLAALIGAERDEVICGDSTSIQLTQALGALARARPGREVVAVDAGEFPGDNYVAAAVARLLGLRVEAVDPARWEPDERTAVVAFSAVNFATGALLDLAAITAAAHRSGALVCWDLSHAIGALPVDLGAVGADAAVGCTYKYVCGGPGAPAFLYVARRHHDSLDLPLTGWHGHAEPFGLDRTYRPAPAMTRARVGTPPVLSMLALNAALDLWDDVDLGQVRAKSAALTGMLIEHVDGHLDASAASVVTPRDPARRGSHVAVRHAHGFEVSRALADAGVIVDFRAPDLVRFGISPLINRYVEVWDAAETLATVVNEERWREARFAPDGRTVT